MYVELLQIKHNITMTVSTVLHEYLLVYFSEYFCTLTQEKYLY